MSKVYLYGASGHGKVIIELLEENGIDNIQVWDDGDKEAIWQYAVKKPSLHELEASSSMIIGIGNNNIRKKIAERYNGKVKFAKAIHPKSDLSKRAIIGEGTVVMVGVSVNTDVSIGRHCIINTNASIDHDCQIGDFVHVSPNATLCGEVHVGEGTHIGAGSVIIQCKKIGRWCTIGAGAVIRTDIPDYATVVGNPGRIIKTAPNEF